MRIDIDERMTEGQPWARFAARRMYHKLPPGRVWEDELYTAALTGLWKAALCYDPSKGGFRHHAELRMFAAMTEWLRRQCGKSRMGGLCDMRRKRWQQLYSLDVVAGNSHLTLGDLQPERHGRRRESDDAGWLVEVASRGLSRQERFILRRYYHDEATMKQIAAELGVHESWVSQTHSRLLPYLRYALELHGVTS